MLSIELERDTHRDAIRTVTEAAFAASEFGHNGEADLVDALRKASEQTLGFVAIQDEAVVGHVMFSPVTIRANNETLTGMGLAPLSVLPTNQRTGIGSQLVTTGLQHLSSINTAFTVVAGDPKFYARFRFVPAFNFGITHGFQGMPQSIFQIRFPSPEDDPEKKHVREGLAFYLPAFGPQHENFS